MLFNKIRLIKAATAMTLSCAMFSVAPVATAANADISACQDFSQQARGLCRAAIRSGCGTDGRDEGSRRCGKFASEFRDLTGLDPVWIAPLDEDPDVEPVSAPEPEPAPAPTGGLL